MTETIQPMSCPETPPAAPTPSPTAAPILFIKPLKPAAPSPSPDELRPSALSPLSVTCDIYKKTTFLLDRDLVGKTLLVHPNMFSRTISIGYYDVIRIWDSYYARYLHMDM